MFSIFDIVCTFDLFGFQRKRIEDYDFLKKTDTKLIYEDWKAVGNDMRKAMSIIDREIKDE